MSRRKERYGKLVPGPRWRTTMRRVVAIRSYAHANGLTITELMERAIDAYLHLEVKSDETE